MNIGSVNKSMYITRLGGWSYNMKFLQRLTVFFVVSIASVISNLSTLRAETGKNKAPDLTTIINRGPRTTKATSTLFPTTKEKVVNSKLYQQIKC